MMRKSAGTRESKFGPWASTWEAKKLQPYSAPCQQKASNPRRTRCPSAELGKFSFSGAPAGDGRICFFFAAGPAVTPRPMKAVYRCVRACWRRSAFGPVPFSRIAASTHWVPRMAGIYLPCAIEPSGEGARGWVMVKVRFRRVASWLVWGRRQHASLRRSGEE